jgi:hypothetical protein
MNDILIALAFFGMVACPALISALRANESEDKPRGFEALSRALANTKAALPAGKGTSSALIR